MRSYNPALREWHERDLEIAKQNLANQQKYLAKIKALKENEPDPMCDYDEDIKCTEEIIAEMEALIAEIEARPVQIEMFEEATNK